MTGLRFGEAAALEDISFDDAVLRVEHTLTHLSGDAAERAGWCRGQKSVSQYAPIPCAAGMDRSTIIAAVAELTRELLRQQDELQAEAEAVELDLQLAALLGAIGEPVRVGSAALGLMVWRDLDLTVVCTELGVEPVAALGARLAAHPRVRRVTFRNDTGRWNTNPGAYPDGLYLGVGYRAPSGRDWKLDIWFVDEPDRQPDLAHLRWMPAQLGPETREAILLVKSAWASRPEYGKRVTSFDIYTAVLKGGVRTREGFEEWVANRHQASTTPQGTA